MTVLVTYGGKNGSTAGIADMIGVALSAAGQRVAVRPAQEVHDLTGYDAVVLGGALYVGRWDRVARRFVHRHARALATMPVWLFSSGPLDDSADRRDIPPVRQAAAAMDVVGAREHVTFGGRIGDDARGFPARRMLRAGMGGDFRNKDVIMAWGRAIAVELDGMLRLRDDDDRARGVSGDGGGDGADETV